MPKQLPALRRLVALLCAASAFSAEDTALELLGKSPVERLLRADNVDRFRIELEKGAYLRLDVLATTGELRVKIQEPGGEWVRHAFVPHDVAAAEPLVIDALVSGTYVIEI